ncbi:MAG: hypothetical protein EHM19_07570 [Candidatus Latescibacterota bacterium]|nr:MAG: hypothetical protein EHM19_07570 [Candidatus Latescibacterota bacterium]
MSGDRSVRLAAWAALVLFLTAWALDCGEDIRGRDCFSWMDPAQYFSFAESIARGETSAGGFEVASVFPLYVAPFLRAGGGTIPSALAANILSGVLLAAVVVLLARAVGLRSHPAVPVVAVLAAPILVGLSRELYVEFTLSWLVGLGYLVWFRSDRLRNRPAAALFAVVFAAGLLLKMTYAVFFAGVFLVEVWGAVRARSSRRLVALAAAFVLPALLVLGGIRVFFPESFGYYASLGNTRIPIMRLIGPPDLFSAESLAYYPSQLTRTVLGLLSIFLLAPLALAGRLFGREADERSRARFGALALWFLVPIVFFTFQVVKEPRHVAPCVVPAVLLVVAALERLRGARLRALLPGALLLVAVGQYLLLTRGVWNCPYRLAGPLSPREIEQTMVRADPEKGPMLGAGGRLDINRWRFTRSIAIRGFEPNEALALAWWFAPAVVYDLSLVPADEAGSVAFERFEDLFYFAALDIYNARCGSGGRTFTLGREDVVGAADFLLVRGGGDEIRAAFPEHEIAATFSGRETTVLLAPQGPRADSYRDLYARAFLERSPPADTRERNTIFFSLFMSSVLRGESRSREELLAGFPAGFEPGSDRRNIFWIAHDFPLQAFADRAFAARFGGSGAGLDSAISVHRIEVAPHG